MEAELLLCCNPMTLSHCTLLPAGACLALEKPLQTSAVPWGERLTPILLQNQGREGKRSPQGWQGAVAQTAELCLPVLEVTLCSGFQRQLKALPEIRKGAGPVPLHVIFYSLYPPPCLPAVSGL